MHNLIARIHLFWLLAKAKLITTWRKLWSKAKPSVVAAEAKVAPVVAEVKVDAKPVIQMVQAKVAAEKPGVIAKLKAFWLRVKGLSIEDKIAAVAAVIILVTIYNVYHSHHAVKPVSVAQHALVVTVTTANPVIVAIPAHLVRVSELTPEGQVFLATTVPSTAIVSATDSGITWHPTAKVTETWHGSYRISQ